MKYISILVCVILMFGVLAIATLTPEQNSNTDYLRIHIRANSNSNIDQQVKYEIKDKVVEALIPYLSECKTKQEAYVTMENKLSFIENVANQVLQAHEFNYKSHAKLTYEEFPTRSYENLTLESGFYDALILELGEAEGNNWWCVVYPPLCFVNSTSQVTQYKSRILEIINDFFS